MKTAQTCIALACTLLLASCGGAEQAPAPAATAPPTAAVAPHDANTTEAVYGDEAAILIDAPKADDHAHGDGEHSHDDHDHDHPHGDDKHGEHAHDDEHAHEEGGKPHAH